jgi:hypothetical protein
VQLALHPDFGEPLGLVSSQSEWLRASNSYSGVGRSMSGDYEYTSAFRWPVVMGMVIGVALVALVWFVVADVHRGGGNGDRAESYDSPRHNQLRFQTQPSRPGRMQRCSDAATALRRPLRAAAASLGQWEVHVGAMNKLVTGAITLRQANAFWSETRMGAYRHIKRFDQASARLKRRGVDCPPPTLLPATAAPAVHQCARQVATELRSLQAARTAIATWHQHMHQMDMLQAGKMSPATAEQMWLAMWQRGVHEIRAYHAIGRAAHGQLGCGDVRVVGN